MGRLLDELFISPRGSSILGSSSRSDILTEMVVQTLNAKISEGSVLWSFGSTQVRAMGHTVVVKIGKSIDVSHLPTLSAIKHHYPNALTPDILGALRSGRKTYIFMVRAPGVSLDRV